MTPTEADPHDELFEVVDAQNVVIGIEKRGVCHKEGLTHRAVYAFVFNPEARMDCFSQPPIERRNLNSFSS